MTVTPRPTIFVSAVTSELKSERELVAHTLSTLGYEAVWQDIFGTEQGDLREMLRRKIDDCEGVVQLVGRRYGFAPLLPDETFGRVSYTQYEALYAKQQGKKVWYLMMDEKFPIVTSNPELADLQQLQAAYRSRLRTSSQLYYEPASREALEIVVLKLRDDLTRLRRRFKQWAASVIALLLIAVAAVLWMNHQLNAVKEGVAKVLVQENPPKLKAGDSLKPKLAFEIFGIRQGAKHWKQLGPESSLCSGDEYYIRVRTFSRGFLYLFQVDASHKLQWLFPANATFSDSIGANPLLEQTMLTNPPGSKAYVLNNTLGEERFYAIYSATRWEKLEEALKNASSNTNSSAQLEIEALVAADDSLDARAKGEAHMDENPAVSKDVVEDSSMTDSTKRVFVANGYWLLQVRRFQHIAATTAPKS